MKLAAALLLLAQLPSLEKEQALGKAILSGLKERSIPYENAEASGYVNRIGAKLTAEPYTFPLFHTPSFNEPASIPGGHIAVPLQFFATAQDESEFAAMIAHAVAHVSQRHFVKVRDGISLYFPAHIGLVPLGMKPEHEALELQADQLAIRLLVKAGFNPHALRTYLARMQSPDTARLDRLDAQLKGLPNDPIPHTGDFPRVKRSVLESLPLSRGRREPPSLRRPR